MGLLVGLGDALFLEVYEVGDFMVVVLDIVVETNCLELLIDRIGIVLVDLAVEF